MNALNYLLPLVTLPFGEGVTPFVNAHRSMGGAAFIWLDNCGKVNIANNAVEWVDANSSAPDGTMLENMKGICLEASISCTVSENVVANIEAGINVWGDCTGSELFCNDMVKCYNGVYFDPLSGPVSTSIIGTQGTIGGGNETWKNKWENNIDEKVGGEDNGDPIVWVYDPSLCTDYDPDPSASFVQRISGNQQNGCTVYDPNGHMNAMMRNSDYGRTVGDSAVMDEDSAQIIYTGKETFYKAAKDNSSLLTLGVSSDTVYQQEFDSLEQTNIGKYAAVREALAANDNSAALSLLASIVDQNQIEENKKYVASVIANGYSPYLDADSDTVIALRTIAYIHPFYGGEAVFWARAILQLNVHDVPLALRKGRNNLQKEVANTITLRGKIHPNPANEEITFSYPHSENETTAIKIYDAFSNIVGEYKLLDKEIKLSVSNYLQAIYFIHVYVNGMDKEVHRFAIIK